MLLYLARHSHPDTLYNVIQVLMFPFCPKQFHEAGLKLSGHYLLGTRTKGLIIIPIRNLNIDAYPDADVAGQIFLGLYLLPLLEQCR